LLELLVVIAIIGLLATVVVASLNQARSNARDTKRLADIQTLRKALDAYYLDHGKYPAVSNPGTVSPLIALGSCGGNVHTVNDLRWQTGSLATALVPDYLSELPIDPINTGNFARFVWLANPKQYGYCYHSGPSYHNNKNYALTFRLENANQAVDDTDGLKCAAGSDWLVESFEGREEGYLIGFSGSGGC